MVVPSSVSWEDVEQGAKEVMKHEIWKTQTWKEFKTTIAAVIRVPVKELTQHKVALQALIAQEGEEGANGNEDDLPEEGVDDEDGDEDDRNECGSSSSDDNDQGDAMPAMRDLARAMNLGPTLMEGLQQFLRFGFGVRPTERQDIPLLMVLFLYLPENRDFKFRSPRDRLSCAEIWRAKSQRDFLAGIRPRPLQGLKQMKRRDAERTLRERLISSGAQFKGLFPSSREIAQARRRTETKNDLDGMDLGNVVQGSRRRERSEDHSSPPKKKRRSVDEQEGTSDGGDCSESHDDESEEEFEL